MATHSSILAWRILWTEKPGGLLSMGSHRAGHNWSSSKVHREGRGRYTDFHVPMLVVVVLSLSYVRLFVTPWTLAHQASLYSCHPPPPPINILPLISLLHLLELTHHNHLKSMTCVTLHSVGLSKWIMTYVYHYGIIQSWFLLVGHGIRDQSLYFQCAHSYWDITAWKSSQGTDLRNIYNT